MKQNRLFIGIGALILVVALIFVSENLSNRKPAEKTLKFFPGLTDKTVAAVVIMDAQDTVKIKRKGDIWMVTKENSGSLKDAGKSGVLAGTTAARQTLHREYPADSASVASMIDKLSLMKKDVEASQNPAKQSLFEVDSVKGTYVEPFDASGKSLGAFRIGKNGADWSSHYVRFIGSNVVYGVSGSIKYSFFTEFKRWRDKTITKFDRAVAKSITLMKKDGTTINLAKAADTGSVWNITSPIQCPAKTDQIDDILGKLTQFTASDIEDPVATDSAMGFNPPELIVNVTLNGGASKKIMIGKAKGDTKNFWVRAEGKDQVFLAGEFDIQKLDKNVDGLKAPAPVDAANAVPAPGISPAPSIKLAPNSTAKSK